MTEFTSDAARHYSRGHAKQYQQELHDWVNVAVIYDPQCVGYASRDLQPDSGWSGRRFLILACFSLLALFPAMGLPNYTPGEVPSDEPPGNGRQDKKNTAVASSV